MEGRRFLFLFRYRISFYCLLFAGVLEIVGGMDR